MYGLLGLAFENKGCINQTSHESPASIGDERFNERDNPDVIAYCRTLDDASLIVLCNFRGVESALDEKTLTYYTMQGYKKILGNYEGLSENLRPFEVIVLEK